MKALLFAALVAAAPAAAMAAPGTATMQDRLHYHADQPSGAANSSARIAAILGIFAASAVVFGVISLQDSSDRNKKPRRKA